MPDHQLWVLQIILNNFLNIERKIKNEEGWIKLKIYNRFSKKKIIIIKNTDDVQIIILKLHIKHSGGGSGF